MTDIAALRRICPPPNTPQIPTDWNAVETELGMILPEDYKQLADTYGAGLYGDYINIFHPNANTPWTNLTGPMPARVRNQLRHDYDKGTHPVPYQPQHLFTIGVTSNGEYLFWITDPLRTPGNWHIAVNEARGPQWYTYEGTLTSFLTSLLNGEASAPQFPSDFPALPGTFAPSTAPAVEYTEAPARPAVSTETIREWARANGHQVPLRGRIPAEILDAWERSNPA
ncbi:histone-like nucleoid-structuring protein Lsr2 [Streptomyces sp. NPDC059533]|uniref:Lsr2 family DNA-binding protein n=1 Tax=unclassified Streptomyces TaxID=2593676 RepID=UPI003689EEC5